MSRFCHAADRPGCLPRNCYVEEALWSGAKSAVPGRRAGRAVNFRLCFQDISPETPREST